MLTQAIISAVVILVIPLFINHPSLIAFASTEYDAYRTGLALCAIGGTVGFTWFLLNKRNSFFFTPFLKKFLTKYDIFKFGFYFNQSLITTVKEKYFLLKSDIDFFSRSSINLPTEVVFENFGSHQARKPFVFCYYIHQLRFFRAEFFSALLKQIGAIFRHPQLILKNSSFWLIFFSLSLIACIFLTGSCIYYNKIIFNFRLDIFLLSKTIKLASWNISTEIPIEE